MTTPPTTHRHRTGPILAVISLALMTVVSAVSGLNVALPDPARETGASQTEITWLCSSWSGTLRSRRPGQCSRLPWS